MGLSSLLKKFSCCGDKGIIKRRDSKTYAQSIKPQIYPTLNDIPLGDWQDSNFTDDQKSDTIQNSVSFTTSCSAYDKDTFPSDEEFMNLRLAIEKLWTLDSNRLNPGLDYELYLHKSESESSASQKLFRYVNEPRILKIPTYKYFYDLLDNFHSKTGSEDKNVFKELSEVDAFLKAFSQTKPGQYLHQYLVAKRLCSADPINFCRFLNEIWFQLYRREGHKDTSAFELVFLGETCKGEIKGFHNWLYFYHEEKAHNLTYHGYVSPHQSHPLQNPDGKEHLMSVRFAWKDCHKPVSSGFVGTSPEFEFALYTLCFLTDSERISASLSGIETDIIVQTFESQGKRRLGSCYPSIK